MSIIYAVERYSESNELYLQYTSDNLETAKHRFETLKQYTGKNERLRLITLDKKDNTEEELLVEHRG